MDVPDIQHCVRCGERDSPGEAFLTYQGVPACYSCALGMLAEREADCVEVASLRAQLAAANEARAEAERQRDEAQADLFRIRDIAGVWERRAGQLANEICEEREQWQDATGLTDGSDPGGVTPAMLSSVMGRFYDLEEASRALIGHEVTLCLVDPPCGNCDACRFGVAIAALPKED